MDRLNVRYELPCLEQLIILINAITAPGFKPVAGSPLSHAATRKTKRFVTQVEKQTRYMHRITVAVGLVMDDQGEADVGTVAPPILVGDPVNYNPSGLLDCGREPISRSEHRRSLRVDQQGLVAPPAATIAAQG